MPDETPSPGSVPSSQIQEGLGSDEDTILKTENLTKEFRAPLSSNSVLALNKLSIDVRRGEVFGLVGPNGSGKTTTLKLLLGLLRPTSGRVEVFGQSARNIGIKQRIGFLPDGPYFYDYLNADELLDFYGKLFKFSKEERRRKTDELLELVGLTERRKMHVKNYSKGMTQRVGLAQALLNDPDLLFLDEPTTGLDPLGAIDMKEQIVGLRKRGKTVFICSHLLADVQAICDRVAILHRGNLVRFGKVEDLLSDTRRTEVVAADLDPEAVQELEKLTSNITTDNGRHVIEANTPDQVFHIMEIIRNSKGKLLAVEPKSETLEDVFVRAIRGGETS
ncbi:MAG: hypothetical protein AUJ92_06135 [Armatimonadetes bacterium CG2_30_59_28]|nr:ABC transporter ATP-binding protein [Armatimonadota bacterium]OIO96373.1 MAG: hypothetical protein AUJ92_06135 [Armatimonadetes bacterium CG2_30_59_28]PIU66479.1 MAG: multidrug ABC transporter ATP-binding protein [Armatimonadetes bacterium CG07_land_8_20_14_0_80_59_28]PIY48735.1 MAG: multidrug ABC transporter ATP-binding protein [Armatimonadetes bacterium CG_4_10_14_3_um_filter_59_10]PJB72222.1 MAG: multidrug ABC transporter ATP-binding protein [Armatimonadetes bacterium CG_4_9_14_3_um_filte